MPARAMTLRRMMEWEADDAELLSRCFPDLPPWPEDKHERAIAVALRAEAHWPALPLPCVYRFPGPLDLPDAWPDATNARPAATPNPPANPFPNAKDELPSSPLAAAIEWLHLARLDRALGQRIASAFPPGEGARWQAAALSLTDPQGHTPIPAALADFESLWHDEHRPAEQKTSALSRTEVDALLCCADDDPDCLVRSPETRAAIHEALLGWLAWIDESGPLTRQMSA
ncbi:MAG: hypothetical protein HXL68_11475 [Dechloromonas agitata]|uniref:Uncharacterized protein n=1 Tax=Dechloromonas agitata TaxID=73030 RepID=A0A930G294_9RHOO|nr:hypothetical protein [Dechloromonas agitata]